MSTFSQESRKIFSIPRESHNIPSASSAGFLWSPSSC